MNLFLVATELAKTETETAVFFPRTEPKLTDLGNCETVTTLYAYSIRTVRRDG